jgi:uncharacterized protein (TIGR02246 family)
MNQRLSRTAAAGMIAASLLTAQIWLAGGPDGSLLLADEPVAVAEPPAKPAGDEAKLVAAVREAAAATVKAFNAADAAALAAMFDAEGELVDEAGNVFAGRDEVAELFTAFFERFPQATLEMEVADVRPLGEDLAVEDGARRITTPDGDAAEVLYTAVRGRAGDAWPIISYREFSADPPPTPREMLEPLAWLVGEWVDESPEGRTTIRYDWSENGSFLEGEYRLAIEGRPVGKTTQRIGWDPIQAAVRSWTFDPDGGFSEGLWLPTDEGWVIRSETTMPDGATGLATVTLRARDQDHFVVESSDRIVAGVAEPDFTLVIARKPPDPAAADAAGTDAQESPKD